MVKRTFKNPNVDGVSQQFVMAVLNPFLYKFNEHECNINKMNNKWTCFESLKIQLYEDCIFIRL